MKLTIEQIKKITKGAVRIEEIDGRIAFFRFTKEQEEAYSTWDADFYKKTFATAGIKLEFYTDSTSLFIKTRSRPAASRRFLANDIFVDGRLVGQVGASFEDCEAAPDYSYLSGKFELGEGKKSMAFNVIISPEEKGFSDKEIEKFTSKILKDLEFKLGISLR